MVKRFLPLVVAFLVLVSTSSSMADEAPSSNGDISTQEEDDFWKRFLLMSLRPSMDPLLGEPSAAPVTSVPSPKPSQTPTSEPTKKPSPSPSMPPSVSPSITPSEKPSPSPSLQPSPGPSPGPTLVPSAMPSASPTELPTETPTLDPSASPSDEPTSSPTPDPSATPSEIPSNEPTAEPSAAPTVKPSSSPTSAPSAEPTDEPSAEPTESPSSQPSVEPSHSPTSEPSISLSAAPSVAPSPEPSNLPTISPTASPTNKACEVQVGVACETSAGQPCDTLDYPSGSCGGDIDAIMFQYIPRPCSQSRNDQQDAFCADFAALMEGLPVMISCSDGSSGRLMVEPAFVSAGEMFTITTPNEDDDALPGRLQCFISNPFGQVAQIHVLDTSGEASLGLFDRFGSMEVVSCDEISCSEILQYNYTFSNVGSADMDITVIDWTYNGIANSLLGSLPTTFLAPNETIVLQDTRLINVCLAGSYLIEIQVEAEPPNGQMCQAEDYYQFSLEPDCIVDLGLTCTVDSDGSDCTSLTSLDKKQCVCEDTCVKEMKFQYSASNCAGATAIGLISCSDFLGGPIGLPVVGIVVSGGEGEELFSRVVRNGETIVVTNGNECISSSMDILIIEPMSASVVQQLTLDSNCELGSSAELLDKYGSLNFIGFQCFGERGQNCFEEVTYELRSENGGQVDFTITQIEVTLHGVTVSAIGNIEPSQLTLLPGEDFHLQKKETFERCEDLSYSAVARVEGMTASSAICKAEERLDFSFTAVTRFPTSSPSSEPSGIPSSPPSPSPSSQPSGNPSLTPSQDPSGRPSSIPSSSPSTMPTNEECYVEVDIDCTTATGEDCNTISAGGSCTAGGTIEVLKFQFVPSSCEDSRNDQDFVFTCEDVVPIPPKELVLVFCAGDDDKLLDVQPMVVNPFGTFVVTGNGGGLPSGIECNVMSGTGETLQHVSLQTSGEVPLSLYDTFGSLRVESCNDLTCIQELCYNYTISNMGSAQMEITVVDYNFNGVVEDLLDLVPTNKNPLLPGESTSFTEKFTINICSEGNFSTAIDVQADPPNGEMCQAQTDYSVVVVPDCKADLDISCSVDSDGSDCSRLTEPITTQCVCSECVEKLKFRYNAAICANVNTLGNGLIECSDFSSGPSMFAARIVIQSGSHTLSDSVVMTGSDIIIGDGSCIEDSITVSISDPISGDAQQYIEIDTSCQLGSDIKLLQSFGALDFVGYTCRGDGAQNCFEDTTYTLLARNIGGVDLSVAEFNVDISGERTDLTAALTDDDIILSPREQLKATKKLTFERCVESFYYYKATLVGETVGTGAICTDEDGRPGQPLQLGTPFPTAAPSSPPSATPTELPTAPPSAGPSSKPSGAPTTEPSAIPTLLPTMSPSKSPSALPSYSPSNSPSFGPSAFPSMAPTESPTTAPTEICVLSVDVDCKLANNNNNRDGESCEEQLGVEPCLERPTSATMLYNGGDCSQSDNIQPLKFTCEDRNGGPPTEEGALSYIVVTDIKGNGIVYFEGFVRVGEEYPLNDNGQRFEADQFITIYGSDDTSNPANVLQVVQYHSSCSSNLELKNRFGASQLVGFFNSVQGNVTCFATANFALQVQIPFDVSGEGVTLTTMTADTNFAGFVNLTDQVAGTVVEPGGTTVVTLEGVIDLTVRKRYSIQAKLTGVGEPTQSVCTGSDSLEFFAGNPASPGTPTSSPSKRPTISPAPTPDPLFTACELDATILCSTLRNPEPSESSCSSLALPSEPQCMSSGSPSRLQWLYNGIPCSASTTSGKMFKCMTMNGGPSMDPPDDVFISVVSVKEDLVYFAGTVRYGSTFVVNPGNDDGFEEKTTMTIAKLEDGEPGQTLQIIELRAECKRDSDIRLLAQYGALQLVAFESKRQGFQSAFEVVDLTYVFKNTGPIGANVEQIVVNSTFTGERNFAPSSGYALRQGDSQSLTFTTPINLYAADGLRFFNEFFVEGTGLRNDIVCRDKAALEIVIGEGNQ